MDLKIRALYQCGACREIHDDEDYALTCCGVDAIKCPSCYRDYASISLSYQAIKIAGHCTTCNPMFTIDQQIVIQDQHYLKTGKREHLHD
jgi:hypothetical protein